MADTEEPRFTTLAQRIAALNQSQGGPASNGMGKKPPPLPQRSASDTLRLQVDFRSNSVNNPPISSFGSSAVKHANNQPTSARSNGILPPPPVDRDMLKCNPQLPSRKQPPALPSRTSSQPITPALPPRTPSDQQVTIRRDSNDSMRSQNSTISTFSTSQSGASTASSVSTSDGRRLPPTLDQASLPPLPPTKRELAEKARLEKAAKAITRAPLLSTKSAPVAHQITSRTPSVPSLPPRLPSRPTEPAPQVSKSIAILPPSIPRRPSPTTTPTVAARLAPPTPTRPPSLPSSKPPPIPYMSKPSESQLTIRGAKPVSAPRPTDECLICRDFSGPDGVAAQYPRLSNPDNSTDYLAEVLCGPFDSPTDKARAIFTWLHYNIDYDVDAFFGNSVRYSSPENTIAKGLAVCGGYAGVYSAIALKAGLECVMVTGHGKGYGYSTLKDGDAVPPPDPTGHAWNAVCIDNGEWKLLDSCWGAGHVSDEKYTRKLSPTCFTASNEDFGEKHFPADDRYFFRADGSVPSWKQYICGRNACEPLQLYGVVGEYGINENSFLPPQKQILIRAGGKTRFQFSKMCPHWDHIRNGDGLPYCMILQVNGLDGREKDFVPFDYDGTFWWADVTTDHLGCAPQKVNVYAVTTIGGRDGRGVTKKEYLSKKGREGMGFQTVATWDLIW